MQTIVSRRAFVVALTIALAVVSAPTLAQTAWPNRAVTLIVPTGAGSAPDVIARLVAERLGNLWGQTVVVDNKPGAGGIPGMSALARSKNDGYTIGFVPAAMATITPLLYKSPQFNVDSDLQAVATVATSPLLLVTNASSNIRSLSDLARESRAQPGKFNLGAPQMNSLPHLAAEMVNKAGNMGLTTVPYPTPPAAVTALIAGDVALTADGVPGLLQHIKSGRLRALAVTSAERLPGFDDVPAVAETYPGFEAIGWFQVFAPAGTPAAVVERINADVNRVTQLPELAARFAELGVYAHPESVAAARDFLSQQQRAMKKLVTDLGISAR